LQITKYWDIHKVISGHVYFQKILIKNETKKLDLKGCIFNNTNLNNSAFIFNDLEKVDFEGSDLSSVVFERCNLKEANLSGCNITGTGFENCNIDKTILDVSGFISYGNSKGFILV
ncbi:MAG: pentapeptide repeat-containing protein, partial [Patescibacteria group bacterium]